MYLWSLFEFVQQTGTNGFFFYYSSDVEFASVCFKISAKGRKQLLTSDPLHKYYWWVKISKCIQVTHVSFTMGQTTTKMAFTVL